ncbi:MAG: hypothetical protein C0599_14565 [Salinivirgaceae bacterium]|nr:MAG: hypothetical protein C0599_14565 [Salinivirgaceae bacterium]
MSKIINSIFNAGTSTSNSQSENRNIVLTNVINFVIFSITLTDLIVEFLFHFLNNGPIGYGTLRILLIALIAAFSLLLSKIGYPKLSKFFLTIFPVLILAYFPSLFNFIREEFLIYVPFGIVGLSLIPHFIYSFKKQKFIYISSIAYFLLMLLMYDFVMFEIAPANLNIIPIIKGNLLFYKIAQVAIFSFINFSVFYLRIRNSEYEEKLEQQSQKLEFQNIELKESKEELTAQNEELLTYQDELNAKNEKLNKALSELKAAQEKLIEAEKMASLGVLTAGVAHEINNPVNYIYNGIIAIESHMEELGLKDNEELKPYFHAIDEGIERVVDIVKSLGRYSRNEDMPHEKISLHEVIDDTLLMLYYKYKNRIEIIKKYQVKEPFVFANEGQLHQVAMNLIINAIQAIPDKGEIIIETKKVGEKLQMSIKDSGIGIKDNVLKNIFDPFFTTKDPGEGTGLGLSISKKIIQEHNGSIQVESMLQKGTTFVIQLPIVTEK